MAFLKKEKCIKLFLEKKDGCLLRQQTYFVSANESPSSLWSRFDKTNLQVVPKNGLLICASSLQVIIVILQVEFISAFKCSYKCSLPNSNLNSKIYNLYFRQ
jgi:hypothetical protein